MACKAVTTWHGIYEEEAAKRGIRVIWIPHALLDPRKADRQSMRDEVNRYMRTVLGEDPFDPSLETIEDQNAWQGGCIMNKLIKIPAAAAGTGAGLFAASLVIYYFNLDMKLIEAVHPYLSKWYDHIERSPFDPPQEVF